MSFLPSYDGLKGEECVMNAEHAQREMKIIKVSTFRDLQGFNRILQVILYMYVIIACAAFVLSIDSYLGIVIFSEQYYGAFLAACLFLVFLGVRGNKKSLSEKVPWYDYLLALAGLACGLYLTIRYPALTMAGEIGYVQPPTVVLGTLFILLVLEAIRRMQGWSLVILISSFIFYGLFTNLFPGVLKLDPTPFPRLINYFYLDPDNMLWLAGIAATIALPFVFFGQVLFVFRGALFIRDLSFAIVGRFRGAPAKVAVVASSLFGTITGGAAVNVMVTGAFTIPMMKSAGYRSTTAGAVEAVASSGGQIMPPIMGIAAFIIAEFLGITYTQVALSAIIPALLFYIAVFIQVDLDAAKLGIMGLPPEERPQLRKTLRDSWLFILPMAILVYFLFIVRRDAATAGIMSAILTIPVILFSKENRKQFWRKLLDAIERTMRAILTVAAILTGAGFIVAVSSVTGLGSVFSIMLVKIAGNNMILLLVIAAIGCMLLGMGMPSMAAYVLVAILVAPALIDMEFLPLAAHMFILYYSIMSNITPPVAIGAYAAAALSGGSSMRTAFSAMRIGILAYIIPFLFVFTPALVLKGTFLEIVAATILALAGTVFLGIAFSGFLFRAMRWERRLLALVISGSFFFPLLHRGSFNWIGYVLGMCLAAFFIVSEWRRRPSATGPASPA